MARKTKSRGRRGKPLTVKVTRDGVLAIEIGIDVNAFAALCSEYAWKLADEKTGRPSATRPDHLFKITNARGFAVDMQRELTREAEDGSSLLTKLFDDAVRLAIEDGSQFFVDKGEP